MKYYVSFSIPDDLRGEIENLRRHLRPVIKNVPQDIHGTLYHFRAKERDEKSIIGALEDIHHPSFFVEGERVMRVFDEGALVIKLKKTDEVDGLHRKVITEVAPYIDRDETKPLPKKYIPDQERRRIYEEYGSVFCAEFYQPHLTLCEVDESRVNGSSVTPFTVLFEVEEFSLSKKVEGMWKVIKSFSLIS